MNNNEITYQHFTIKRQSGTYADVLEAFGLASLLEKINAQIGFFDTSITLENKGGVYTVSNSHAITIEQINQLRYFQVIKFIKTFEKDKKGKENKKYKAVPIEIGNDYFDYVAQRAEKEAYSENVKAILKEKDKELLKRKLKALREARTNEFGNKIDKEYDVYSQLIGNPYVAFCDLYDNFDKNKNQENFQILLREILDNYSIGTIKKRTDSFDNTKIIDQAEKEIYLAAKKLVATTVKKDTKPTVEVWEIAKKFKVDTDYSFDGVKNAKDKAKETLNDICEKYGLGFTSTVTAQQLLNPNQGKGLNQRKADNANMKNLDGFWISETMKIAGAFEMMFCQNVLVSSRTYDTKVYVPDFRQVNFKAAKELQLNFKKYLKSVSPIKLDIVNVINYAQTFLKLKEDYKRKLKDTISGIYTVYQKDLGQNKAVANISYLEMPIFIEFDTKKEGADWIEILEEQKELINNITEQGDAIQGLLAYRSFISSSNLDSFFRFGNWYSMYLMQSLAKKNRYVRFFSIETLNKFYTMLDKNNNCKIQEIINNQGFLAVAKAIRQSTVVLQSLPKGKRKFEIRYGIAQQIQNKSKSCDDLIAFIGDFIATYNAETSKFTEKVIRDEGKELARANVKIEELNDFYALFDTHSPKKIGSLLASYGFAKPKKDDDKVEKLKNLADELGYELIKIDNENHDTTQQEENQEENNF